MFSKICQNLGSNTVQGAVKEISNPATQAALATGAIGVILAFKDQASAKAIESAKVSASDMGANLVDSAVAMAGNLGDKMRVKVEESARSVIGDFFSLSPNREKDCE